MIQFENVSRTYETGEREVHALVEANLEIARGEFVAVTGPSGCGKSTLLHLLGALDQPTSGRLAVDGVDLTRASEPERTAYRRKTAGMIFQFFNLMPTLSMEENVMLPLLLQGVSRSAARDRAVELLSLVGLEARGTQMVQKLSGGEMQRTAICRALAHRPQLVIADEPTGNLDSENTETVLRALDRVHQESGVTLVVVTHSDRVAEHAGRRVRMRDGRVLPGE